MDQFGVLTESYGLKPQGKSAPMASAKRATDVGNSQTGNFGINSGLHSKSDHYGSRSSQRSTFDYGSFLDDNNGVFKSRSNNNNSHNFGGLDDGFDIFGGPNKPASQSNGGNDFSFDYDSIFMGPNDSVSTSSSSHNHVDDIFGGMPGLKNSAPAKTNHGLAAFPSPPKHGVPVGDSLGKIVLPQSKSKNSNKKGSDKLAKSVPEVEDLITGFGGNGHTNNRYRALNHSSIFYF